MGSSAVNNIARALPASFQLISSTHLATLWSSYGHIYRLSVLIQGASSTPTSLILKTINPPNAPSADESHIRKLVSYNVERYFYCHLSSRLQSPCPARVARSYPTTEKARKDCLLLEDLEVDFPLSRGHTLELQQTQAVLRWLANFHAAFWGCANDSTDLPLIPPPLEVRNPSDVQGAWAQGGYWYLDTRREEFSCIDSEWILSVPHFEAAAQKLKTECVGKTLIHGDCKAANILFSGNSSNCALYDFQYVGCGLGVQDLVYFIGTSVDGSLLRKRGGDEELLRFYYRELNQALSARGVNAETENYSFEVMKRQFEIALVDWMRFMAGWGTWGNARWVETSVRSILKRWAAEGHP